MPANLLHSLIQYTTVAVDERERVVPLASPAVFDAPFCYLAGHKLVQFGRAERDHFERYVRHGGFVFADDCNHDIDGLFARSFEAQMAALWRAAAGRHGAYSQQLWVTILALLYGGGLRRGELVRLDLDHYDRTAGTLRVDGRKTGQERCIPLPDLTLRALEALLADLLAAPPAAPTAPS